MLDIDLIRGELLRKSFVSEIHYAAETGSTNCMAKNLEGDGLLVIAEYQEKGKGRYEREWESEKGSNLTFSIKKVLRLDPGNIQFVNFFFSYYTYYTIRDFLSQSGINPAPLTIKWPNDIMFNNKKISGLLVESNVQKNEYVIGIGININQEKFKAEFSAASLKNITGRAVNRSEFLLNMIKNFNDNLHLLESAEEIVFNNWKKATNLIGKSVIFNTEGIMHKYGNVTDLCKDGSIKLLINRQEKVFYSGDIKITLIGN